MASSIDPIAFHQWKHDVGMSIAFQWCLLILVCLVCAVFSVQAAINASLVGGAVAMPNTALGAWMGLRLMLGKANAFSVFLGGIVKTIVSTALISAAFIASQAFGWVWQGFFAGLVSMVLSPLIFGLTAPLFRK